MFEKDYIMSLLNNCPNNDKTNYIINKIKRHKTIDKLTLREINYIRKCNKLVELDIASLQNFLYETMISYSDIYKYTGISRSMMCMILHGSRNCTVYQLNKIIEYINSKKLKFDWR